MSQKDVVLVGRIQKINRPRQSTSIITDITISVEDLLRGDLRSNYFKQLEVFLNLPEDRKTAYKTIFRKDTLCFIMGVLKKSKGKTVFSANDCVVTNKAAMDLIKKNLNEDPNSIRAQVVEAGGFSLASRPDLINSKELCSSQILGLQQWLVNHNLPFDLDTAWGIQTYFQNRSTARSTSDKKINVLGLLKKNPLMLADFSPDMPVSKLKKIFESCDDIKITPEMEILARISEALFRASKRGHSCVPLGKLSFYPPIQQLLDQLGVPKEERSKKIIELAFLNADYRSSDLISDRRNLEPVITDIREYYRSCMQESVGMSKEELSEYNRGRFLTTWMIDRLGNFIYLPKLFVAEKYLAKEILAHLNTSVDPIIPDEKYLESLNQEQAFAVLNALHYPISVIIGGAGTGKTFVIKRLFQIAMSLGKKAPILAPTATAAANAGRGSEQSEYFTIHRYAKIAPTDDDLGTTYETNTSPKDIPDGSFVIIDEMSMCTLPILYKVFKAIEGKNVHIVLVGDDKQLPAVGANVFQSFAAQLFGNDIPVTRLIENRRSEGNLVSFTNKIRSGVFEVPDCDEIKVVDTTARRFFSKTSLDYDNTLILTSTRADQLRLNELLRPIEGKATDRIILSDNEKESDINTTFFVGDPVIANRNDYYELDDLPENPEDQTALFATRDFHHPDRKTNIYNGTFGRIESFDKDANTIYIRLYPPEAPKEGVLLPYYTEELSLLFDVAYAVTTHKAQGGERDTVVFVMDQASSKEIPVRRSMLYTAATRAKQQLFFIGKEEFFKNAASVEEEDFLCLLPFRYKKEKLYPESNIAPAMTTQSIPEKKVFKPKKSRFRA